LAFTRGWLKVLGVAREPGNELCLLTEEPAGSLARWLDCGFWQACRPGSSHSFLDSFRGAASGSPA